MSVLLNPDGSRTVYQADSGNHTSIATTTEASGKLREKIRYDIDNNGRFLRGQVFGPHDQLRFTAKYRYDDSNHLIEEIHLGNDESVVGRLVFHYDTMGHQIGYSAYDGAGRLLGETTAPASPAVKRP